MKYDVYVKVVESGVYKGIEASSPEEAEEIAETMFECGDTSWENAATGYDDIAFVAEKEGKDING